MSIFSYFSTLVGFYFLVFRKASDTQYKSLPQNERLIDITVILDITVTLASVAGVTIERYFYMHLYIYFF
jgi:hypothetical protein